MRDTDKRAREPFQDTAEPGSSEDMSTVEPVSAAETAPIPVDEAGLERGRTAPDAPRLDDEPVTDRPTDRQSIDGQPMDGQPLDGQPIDGQPIDGRPMDGQPMTGTPVTERRTSGTALTDEPMFADDVADQLRNRWRELQADFVDDPERAVRAADDVVEEMMKTITERRQRLTGEWQGHTDTEELRQALRGYRSFFDTLLPH